jgi:hypothetical protein
MQNMNPQDMMQKFQQQLQQVVALQQAQQAAGGNPSGSNLPNNQQIAMPMPNPWASSTVTSASAMQGAMASPALMAQAAQMAAGMPPMGPMGGFPMVSTPPLMHSQQQNVGISPPRAHSSSPNHPIACHSGSSSASRGIPAGIGANGKPAVACEICGKKLADPSSLYRHRKIHNGEKPHECPFCGRKFIQRYNMTQHIKTHFKARGINSLANNPATLANFLQQNRNTLAEYQIPQDMINSWQNGEGMVVQEDQDNNTYADERGLGGPDDMDQAQADRALAAQAMVDQANAGLAQARAAQAQAAQAAEAAINEDYDNISQDDDNQEIDPGC